MEIYRPKQYVMYYFGWEQRCFIHCYPQQRWELVKKENRVVDLHNPVKHITIQLTLDDFYTNWRKA